MDDLKQRLIERGYVWSIFNPAVFPPCPQHPHAQTITVVAERQGEPGEWRMEDPLCLECGNPVLETPEWLPVRPS